MLGRLHYHDNEAPHDAAAQAYARVLVYDGAEFETLLLTPTELERIRERSERNPEDHLSPSWWDRLKVWVPFLNL